MNYDAFLTCSAAQTRGTSNDKGEASNTQVLEYVVDQQCTHGELLYMSCGSKITQHTLQLQLCLCTATLPAV